MQGVNKLHLNSSYLYSLLNRNILVEAAYEEREVMEAVWMQFKGSCEKRKEETKAQNEHICKKLIKSVIEIIYERVASITFQETIKK